MPLEIMEVAYQDSKLYAIDAKGNLFAFNVSLSGSIGTAYSKVQSAGHNAEEEDGNEEEEDGAVNGPTASKKRKLQSAPLLTQQYTFKREDYVNNSKYIESGWCGIAIAPGDASKVRVVYV